MTRIKDRAYVVYATEEQAETTRHAITGIEWPLGNGNSLRPKYACDQCNTDCITSPILLPLLWQL